jgi:hypothetical protein
MNCKCNVLRGTAAVAATNLTITLPNVDTLMNGDVGKFVIINAIDYTNPLGTVSIIINGTTFPLKTRFGNNARIEQLRSRKVYTIGLGAETPNFTLLTCIPESSFSFPTYSA